MKILRYVFLGLAVLIATVIGWRSVGGPPSRMAIPFTLPSITRPSSRAAVPSQAPVAPPAVPRQDQARAEVLKRLDEVPQFSAFYKDLAAGFPHVYANLVDHEAKTLLDGGKPPSAGALIWEALRNLQQSNGILAAGADEGALAMFFDARLSMLDVLATVDQRTCADFLYGTTDPSIEGFSIAHRDLVADMAGKQLAAIEDGQRRHLDPAAPSADDLDLVANGLAAKKLSPEEISMLLDGKSPDPPLPDSRLCEIGRTYLSVLKDLPPVVRQRIYGFTAELLARS